MKARLASRLRRWADRLSPRYGLFISPKGADSEITGFDLNAKGTFVTRYDGAKASGYSFTGEGGFHEPVLRFEHSDGSVQRCDFHPTFSSAVEIVRP